MNTENRIEDIQKNGYELDFSTVFNESFENYKKIAFNAGIVLILLSVVVVGIAIGITGIFWGSSSFVEKIGGFKIQNFSALTLIVYVLFFAILSGLVSPITAGILKIADLAQHNQEFSIATAFEYYRGTFFKELFLSAILIALISGGISTTIESFGIPLLGTLVTYFFSFFTFLTIPLIIFGNLKAIDAIKGSCVVVSKQFFLLMGLLLLAIIIASLGFIGFCIGIFFTLPFIYATLYCIYNAIFGTENRSELDEIGLPLD